VAFLAAAEAALLARQAGSAIVGARPGGEVS
jgi:hypothetical protein